MLIYLSNYISNYTKSYYHQGRMSLRIDFALSDKYSGNFISKAMIKSPFFVGSLGNGSPSPWILWTKLGLIISLILNTLFSPSRVGTSTFVPHNAWKRRMYTNQKHKTLKNLAQEKNWRVQEKAIFVKI